MDGQVAALSRFISRSTDRCVKVFRVLKNYKLFDWSPKYVKDFEDLKGYLTSPSILSKPKNGEKLYVYLAVSAHVVSSVLVRIAEGTKKPIYYINKVLKDTEIRYSDIEKLAFAPFMSSKKLRLYFQSHTIMVVTSYLLRAILHNFDVAGQLMKWSVALIEFHIVLQPRTALKA